MKINLKPLVWILSVLLVSCSSTKQPPSGAGKEGSKTRMQTSDLQGTYTGILPCTDCDGVLTVVTIGHDLSYLMQTRYIGKSRQVFDTKGKAQWDRGSGIVTIGTSKYQAGDHKLTPVGKQANDAGNQTAEQWMLTKAGPGIENKPWRMFEAANRPVANDSLQPAPWFRIDLSAKSVTGNTGCNSLNGTVALPEPEKIKFSNMALTLMACPEMQNEAFLMRSLYAAEAFTLSNDTLTLRRAAGTPLARFKADYFAE